MFVKKVKVFVIISLSILFIRNNAFENIAGPFLLGAAGGFVPGGSIIPGFGLMMLAADDPKSARDTSMRSFGVGMLVGTIAEAVSFGKFFFNRWFNDDDDDEAPVLKKSKQGNWLDFEIPTAIASDVGLKLFELKLAFF